MCLRAVRVLEVQATSEERSERRVVWESNDMLCKWTGQEPTLKAHGVSFQGEFEISNS